MSSMLSDTQICNMALDLLEEAPIDSIDDDRSAARWFKRNFWPTAWALMRLHPWNFCIARASLTPATVAPASGWGTAYTLPADCLRLLPLSYGGYQNSDEIPFSVEGNQVFTNGGSPLLIRYIKRIDNTGLFDNQFCDALAANLAMKAAHFITGKQSYVQAMGQMFQTALSQARVADSLEGTPDRAADDFWVNARGGCFGYDSYGRYR